MGLILGILTGASLLACALVAVWMAGAIYFDVCGGAGWGRWVALGWAVGVVAMFVAWRPLWQPIVALLGGGVAVPRLVAPAEAEPRPRLGPERGRAAAGRDRRGCGHDRERPQLRIPFARRFHAAVRNPHLSSLESAAAWTSFSSTGGSRLMGHPVLVFDFGPDGRICMSIEVRLPEGAEVLGPPQPVSAAGADLRRRGRARRHPAAHEVQPSVKRRTCTASIRAPRSCGPLFLDYVGHDQSTCTRRPRWYHVPVHELHDVLLPASQHARSAGTGASSPTPGWIGPSTRTVGWTGLCPSRNSADSPTSTTSRTQPRRTGFGDHIRRELERRRHER